MVIQRCLQKGCFTFLGGRLHAYTIVLLPPICRLCTATPFSLAGEALDEFSDPIAMHHNSAEKRKLVGCTDDGIVRVDELCKLSDNLSSMLSTLKLFCNEGKLKEALLTLSMLNKRGFQVKDHMYVSVLQLCMNQRDFIEGKQVHDYIVRHLLHPNMFLANTLINFYAKCGYIIEAKRLFDRIQDRDLFTWTIMIEAFADDEHSQMAFKLFAEMETKGIKPDEICFLSVLKACGNLGAAAEGKILHAYAIMYGLKSSILVGSSLIEMYTKCAILDDALQVFLFMGSRDVVVWNLIIAACAEFNQSSKTFKFWELMKQEGVICNGFSLFNILKACARLDQVKKVHASGIASDNNLSLCFYNSLINAYFRFEAPLEACQVFERMPIRDVVSWNSIISGYVQQGSGQEALELLEKMVQDREKPDFLTLASALKACTSVKALQEGKEIHSFICATELEKNKYLSSTLIDMYGKCGDLMDAQKVFGDIQEKDVVIWNSMIAVLIAKECCEEALLLFGKMGSLGVQWDNATLVNVLKASAFLNLSEHGVQIHACIVESSMQLTIMHNTLIDMYLKCGMPWDARAVFNKMQKRDVVSWNVLISGYVQLDCCEEALALFRKMQPEEFQPDTVTFLGVIKACANLGVYDCAKEIHACIDKAGFGSDISIRNALVDMYGKCGRMDVASQVFEESPERDIISWNAVITGYVQQRNIKEVAMAFSELLQEGVEPDDVTFISILKACADATAIEYGKQIYTRVRETKFKFNTVVKSILFDMYAKSGIIESACKLFEGVMDQDIVSCNALTTGYAQHGFVEEALQVFSRMESNCGKWELDHISYVSIISAFSHMGLVAEGFVYFESMQKDHNIMPSVELYVCLIDLLGRSGLLDEALTLASNMGVQPIVDVWMAVLSTSKSLRFTGLAKNVADYVLELDEDNTAVVLLLLNTFVMPTDGSMDQVNRLAS